MRTKTEARLHFTRGRCASGRLIHKVRSCTIYWYDGKPKHVYTTWECGMTTPVPATPVDDLTPLTCRGCAGAEAVAHG